MRVESKHSRLLLQFPLSHWLAHPFYSRSQRAVGSVPVAVTFGLQFAPGNENVKVSTTVTIRSRVQHVNAMSIVGQHADDSIFQAHSTYACKTGFAKCKYLQMTRSGTARLSLLYLLETADMLMQEPLCPQGIPNIL